jgi:hypothetical protein
LAIGAHRDKRIIGPILSYHILGADIFASVVDRFFVLYDIDIFWMIGIVSSIGFYLRVIDTIGHTDGSLILCSRERKSREGYSSLDITKCAQIDTELTGGRDRISSTSIVEGLVFIERTLLSIDRYDMANSLGSSSRDGIGDGIAIILDLLYDDITEGGLCTSNNTRILITSQECLI